MLALNTGEQSFYFKTGSSSPPHQGWKGFCQPSLEFSSSRGVWQPRKWKKMRENGDSCHSRVIWNQQYLYPKFPPTAVVKLLQYSGSRVEHRDGFSSYK